MEGSILGGLRAVFIPPAGTLNAHALARGGSCGTQAHAAE